MEANFVFMAMRLRSIAIIILGLLALQVPLLAQQNSAAMLFGNSRYLAEKAIWQSVHQYLPDTYTPIPLVEDASSRRGVYGQLDMVGANSSLTQTNKVSHQEWLHRPVSRTRTRRAVERPVAFTRSNDSVNPSHEISEVIR